MVEYTRLSVGEPTVALGERTSGNSGSLSPIEARMQDWRQAIQIPTAYRIGNSTVRLQYQFVLGVVAVGIVALIMFYSSFSHMRTPNELHMLEKRLPINKADSAGSSYANDHHNLPFAKGPTYNSTYPFTQPVRTSDKGVRYRIAIISDLDTNSKRGEDEWISYLKTGHLYVDLDNKKVNFKFC